MTNNNDNNNTLLAALSALTGMRACAELHAPGGVDFAANMVTKRFALAARQIRVCVIFRPMGDKRTKAGAGPLPRHLLSLGGRRVAAPPSCKGPPRLLVRSSPIGRKMTHTLVVLWHRNVV